LGLAIISHERGIPSKRESSARADYVPALCTHRPSLLPIDVLVRNLDWDSCGLGGFLGKIIELISSRGSKSRNKVSVGEPAEGSSLDSDVITR
jgi:hypothetical protein